ncbi:hypothetical protein L218DRAFT_941822 [Marasmius fiardii PR-910]|nr:hypothetical protein L218DRAFT_941822 [Marasmius fiardii PR-910]
MARPPKCVLRSCTILGSDSSDEDPTETSGSSSASNTLSHETEKEEEDVSVSYTTGRQLESPPHLLLSMIFGDGGKSSREILPGGKLLEEKLPGVKASKGRKKCLGV